MKRFMLISFALLAFNVSCTVHPVVPVGVSFFSDCPWEEASGYDMWHMVRVFDGEKVTSFYLGKEDRSFVVHAHMGKAVLVVAEPLGTLAPLGGWWDGSGELFLYPEWGRFVSAMVDLAEERPEAVAELDLSMVLEAEPDLRSIDVGAFSIMVADGAVSEGKIPYNKVFRVPLDGILTGRWISLQTWSDSFVVSSIHDESTLRLYPGVWYYLSFERNLMLQVVVSEDGKCSTRLSAPPKWY